MSASTHIPELIPGNNVYAVPINNIVKRSISGKIDNIVKRSICGRVIPSSAIKNKRWLDD